MLGLWISEISVSGKMDKVVLAISGPIGPHGPEMDNVSYDKNKDIVAIFVLKDNISTQVFLDMAPVNI